MSEEIEEKLKKIPVINVIVSFFKQLKLPAFEGLSVYDLLELYGMGILKGALTTRASAIAFSFFTAIFPFLLFVVILIPYIPIDGFRRDFEQFLDSFLPPQTSDFFFDYIFQDISQNTSAGLISTVFVLSILLMANGVNSVFSGFESSYHKQLYRNIVRQYLFALGIALILAAILIVTVLIFGYIQIYLTQSIEEAVKQKNQPSNAWLDAAKYLLFVVMIYFGTATLYYFGTKEGKHSRFFSLGAVFTTLLIMVISYLFGIYIQSFARYNELYGSVGALLILLFYLWLVSNILLLGYELNASIQYLRKNPKKDA